MSTTTGPFPAVDAARVPLHRRLRFLVTPKWIALIIGVIAFAMACYLILAPWQFGRNSQRSAQNAAIVAAEKADPVPIGQLMATRAEPDPANAWHRATVTGTFVPSSQAYVRLRQDADGNPASEVVVTLRTADGTAVLIDRGYVPAASVSDADPLPALPTGTVTVTGRVQPDETDPKARPPERAPDGLDQFYAVNAAQITGAADSYRGYLQLTDDSPGVLTPIGMPQRDSGPFLSYALQWLAFGAMAVLGIGFFIYRELTEPAGDVYLPEDDDNAADGDPGTADAAAGAAGSDAPGDAEMADAAPDAAGADAVTQDAADGASSAAEPARAARRKRWDPSELYDPH